MRVTAADTATYAVMHISRVIIIARGMDLDGFFASSPKHREGSLRFNV